MQTKNFFPLCLAVVLLAITTSCNKQTTAVAQTKTEMLTSGQWHISAFTVSPAMDFDGDGIPESDVYATYSSCDKDNYFVFRKDGKVEVNQGPMVCPGDPQSELKDWSFANNETEIIIDGDRCTIKDLTATRFNITQPILSSTGDVTFTK
jgi:hypothetical protein